MRRYGLMVAAAMGAVVAVLAGACAGPTPNPPLMAQPTAVNGISAFPGPADTGVPADTTLTDYNGPMTITEPGTMIVARLIRGTLKVAAANVTITRSKIIGNLDVDSAGSSVVLEDVEVDGAPSKQPAIGFDNITMRRVDVHGSRVSVLCGSNCDIQDSWLHGQYLAPGADWHVNGYVSNGGSNVIVRHNTLACEPLNNPDGGGCTGPASSFGDFAPLRNIAYELNLFVAGPGSYCLYAGYNPEKPYGDDPAEITVTNNIFQRGANGKCASYGPVTSFKPGSGNVWSGNRWDDGTEVPAGG
ncbi:hypothetical protein [Rhodococcus sp. NPDC127528]|uniref:hypothetical protein n=1 Tax=unclassified Rhodococcus (in: high G+C Gram-positive bacteria) TaxID=192944 RepID=UPI0036453973